MAKVKIELLAGGKAKLTFSIKRNKSGSPHAVTCVVDSKANFASPKDRTLAMWREWKVGASRIARDDFPTDLVGYFESFVYGADRSGPVDVETILTAEEIAGAKDVLAKMRKAGAIA